MSYCREIGDCVFKTSVVTYVEHLQVDTCGVRERVIEYRGYDVHERSGSNGPWKGYKILI